MLDGQATVVVQVLAEDIPVMRGLSSLSLKQLLSILLLPSLTSEKRTLQAHPLQIHLYSLNTVSPRHHE